MDRQTHEILAEYQVRTREMGDQWLHHEPCGEEVCEVESGDSLDLLCRTVLAQHKAHIEAMGRTDG